MLHWNRWNRRIHSQPPIAIAAIALSLGMAGAPDAWATSLTLSPETTQIRFRVPSTLHTVEGTANLVSGSLRFAAAGGNASGEIVIDAKSLQSGSGLRDRRMHEKLLESETYPQIRFLPESLEIVERSTEAARVVLVGRIRIHGQDHLVRIPAELHKENQKLRIHVSFQVPYVEWGMADMSNFFLKVDPIIQIEVDALATVEPPLPTAPSDSSEGEGS